MSRFGVVTVDKTVDDNTVVVGVDVDTGVDVLLEGGGIDDNGAAPLRTLIRVDSDMVSFVLFFETETISSSSSSSPSSSPSSSLLWRR